MLQRYYLTSRLTTFKLEFVIKTTTHIKNEGIDTFAIEENL